MAIRRGLSPADIARRNRQEIIAARLSRRDLFRLGLLGAAGYLAVRKGLSNRAYADDPVVSPPTRPFVQPLALPGVQQPAGPLTPAPQVEPLPGEGRTQPHQLSTRFPPQKFYEVHQDEFQFSFHPDLPDSTIWGFDGHFPGRTYHARYGEPILVRNVNDLPQDHKGFGIPQVSTHFFSGTVSKLRPDDGRMLGSYAVGDGAAGIAFDGTRIWVAAQGENLLLRLDPRDGRVIERHPTGAGPIGVVSDGSQVWVANFNGDSVSATAVRPIEPGGAVPR